MVKWIIGAVVAVVVVIFTFIQIDPNSPNNGGNNSTSEVVDGEYQAIVIEGQVVYPGSYSILKTKTVGDLILQAGGLLESADKDALILDTLIENRELIYVPKKASYNPECEITDAPEKININTANAEQLATINGISIALGNAIVSYREANGPFKALEDIQNVSGIGVKTYEKIRDYIKLK